MNNFLAKFSDFNPKYEKQLDRWKKSQKKRSPIKRKKKKAEPKVTNNHRKGKTYDEFLDSPYWKSVRFKVLKRDGFKCVVCGETRSLIVHHETYKYNGIEHTHLNTLTTLCDKCHKTIHGIVELPIDRK